MTVRRTTALIAALLLLLPVLACRRLSEALGGSSETAAPASEPSASPLPEPTEAVESPENPVCSLFRGFYSSFGKASDGLLDKVTALADRQTAELYLSLMGAEAELGKLYMSVGMLRFDGSYYTGTYTGPCAGTGTLFKTGRFSYDFDSGARLEGNIRDGDRVSAVLTDGGSRVSLFLLGTEDGFVFRVGTGRTVAVLKLGEDGLRFGSFPSGTLDGVPEDGFPEGGPVLVYDEGTVTVLE